LTGLAFVFRVLSLVFVVAWWSVGEIIKALGVPVTGVAAATKEDVDSIPARLILTEVRVATFLVDREVVRVDVVVSL